MRILISYYQEVVGGNKNNVICFYEGLEKELTRFGNIVFMLNMNNHKENYFDHTVQNPQALSVLIKKFKPEIIFTFNNQMVTQLLDETDCPVVIFDADSVNLFSNKDLIPKHLDRYYMVTFYEGWEKYKHLGIPQQRIATIHPATVIQADPMPKDKNISFIGSKFRHLTTDVIDYLSNNKNSQAVYQALLYHWQTNDYDYENCLNKFCNGQKFLSNAQYAIFDQRTIVLSSLLDLGLHLYGSGWDNITSEHFCLACAFNKTPVFSIAHNQHVYNSSKISLSISHPQTKGYAFPWRIYDILASDSLLISSYSKLLEETLKGHVEIPMYKSPYDAREFCKYYLNNPGLHQEIIEASNQFIGKHGRWKSNFRILEGFLNIKLINKQ